MNDSSLGDRIRAFRSQRGWSQNELASRAGVKQPTLQRIEASKRQDPGFSIVARIAFALGISLDVLAPGHATRDGNVTYLGQPNERDGDANDLRTRIERLELILVSRPDGSIA